MTISSAKISVGSQQLTAQLGSASPLQHSSASAKPDGKLREVFQKFVAGTFYNQMFKAMRKMNGRAAYFHGGQAEEMFQSRMDQQVSESLAKKRGASLTEPLFQAFSAQLRARALARNQLSAAQRPADRVINLSPPTGRPRTKKSTSGKDSASG